jgi:hypothetical protein
MCATEFGASGTRLFDVGSSVSVPVARRQLSVDSFTCPAGQVLDVVEVDGNNGSCDCNHYCATNWANKVKARRPSWQGATCHSARSSHVAKVSGGNDASATNLAACTGECDSDDQCATGLKCFQRELGEDIPGCDVSTAPDGNWDYCYDPKLAISCDSTSSLDITCSCVQASSFCPGWPSVTCQSTCTNGLPTASQSCTVVPPTPAPTSKCARFATRISLPCGSSPCDANLMTPGGTIGHNVPDVIPVQNQGRCGACYAFAAAQVLSQRVAMWRAAQGEDMKLGQPTPQMISPQYLLSCSKDFAAGLCANKGYSCGGGCGGGFAIVAYEYMAGSGVATCSANGTSGCVPYNCAGGATDPTCAQATCNYYAAPHYSGEACCEGGLEPGFLTRERFTHWGKGFFTRDPTTVCANTGRLLRPRSRGHCLSFNSKGWTQFFQYNIRREMHLNGLVSATMLMCESFHTFFNGTNSDAVYDQGCSETDLARDAQGDAAVGYHEVVLAGWGEQSDKSKTPYWLVKNSWGAAWNGDGYFKIKRGENTAGIEGTVCMIGPKTDVLVPHAKFNPRGIWTLVACGFGNNDTDHPLSAGSTQCDLGTTRKAGGWTASKPLIAATSTYHSAVHAAARHAVTQGRRSLRALANVNATASIEVLAAHSQSVAGVNRRVLLRVGGGAVVEARVHRDVIGQHALLAEPVAHSCTAPGDASCTAHPECCTAVHAESADACGACIATKMHEELQDAPPPPSQEVLQAQAEDDAKAVQQVLQARAEGDAKAEQAHSQGEAKGKAEGKAEGNTEGALIGSIITAVCLVAAQLLWNGAQRRRAQGGPVKREGHSLDTGAPAKSEWEEHLDADSGHAYYINTRTKETSWEDPRPTQQWSIANPLQPLPGDSGGAGQQQNAL